MKYLEIWKKVVIFVVLKVHWQNKPIRPVGKVRSDRKNLVKRRSVHLKEKSGTWFKNIWKGLVAQLAEQYTFNVRVPSSSLGGITQMDNDLFGNKYHLVTRKGWSKMLLFQLESRCYLFGVKNQITCRDRRQYGNCHHYPTHTQVEINLARI